MAVSRFSLVFPAAAAAILALASCSSPAAPPAPGSASASSAAPHRPAQQSPAAVAQPTVQPTLQKTAQAPAKLHTEAELAALLGALTNAQAEPLTMVSAAQLASGAGLQRKALDAAQISPDACRVLAASNAELPANGVYAAGGWFGDVAGSSTVVTVIAAQPQLLAGKVERARDKIEECAVFTITVAGQPITTSLTRLPVDIAADSATANFMSQSFPDGTVMNMANVEALQGGLLVSVIQLGPEVTKESAVDLGKLVDQVLDAA